MCCQRYLDRVIVVYQTKPYSVKLLHGFSRKLMESLIIATAAQQFFLYNWISALWGRVI